MVVMNYEDYVKIAKIGDNITFAPPEIHCKRRTDTVVGFTINGDPIYVCRKSRSRVRHIRSVGGGAWGWDKEQVFILSEEEYKKLPMFNKEVDCYAKLDWED